MTSFSESDRPASAGGWKPPRPEPATCSEDWSTLTQVCKALGVSRWTMNRLVKSGELKAGLHFRYWALKPNQKRPKTQYCLAEIEKELSRISMRHHRLRLRVPPP